jgi:AcrR family transcriptional regulator
MPLTAWGPTGISHRMVTKSLPIAARRDSGETKTRILDALGRLIVRDGLAAVGINALAREAQADKVLIYRYFGDLDGVYRAYAERSDFWYSNSEMLDGIQPSSVTLPQAIKLCLRRHASEIRKRPVTLAVLAAEAAQRTPLVIALEAVRERRTTELVAWLAAHYQLPRGFDLEAIAMLLGAAINYLAARSRSIGVMSGVGIKTDKDWDRILAAADQIVDRIFQGA